LRADKSSCDVHIADEQLADTIAYNRQKERGKKLSLKEKPEAPSMRRSP